MSDTPKRPDKLPNFAKAFRERYPEVWNAYSELGEAAGKAGPMDGRTLRLVKLGLAVGARSEGSVHSHTRRGLAEGIPAEELEQVALLAITSLGYSNAMAALAWITDVTRPTQEEASTKE
jgi:alkylhydroperoxidase/carboxymuconolactone decarboxylase family protein YurZ